MSDPGPNRPPDAETAIDNLFVRLTQLTDQDLRRIVTYCQKDVITVAQVFLRMNGEALIRQENIEIKCWNNG